jgi:hypothetical protein
MKTTISKLFFFTAFVVILTGTAEASGAVQLADTSVLFTIDFAFEDATFDNQVPILAEHGVSYNDRVDVIGYTLEGENDTDATISEVNALVLSKAKLSGTRYSVAASSTESFTLFILATFDQPLEDNTYRARITKLPYWLDGRRTSVHQNQLNALVSPELKVE